MDYGSETLATLVKLFSRMPGIGRKSAQRLALHILKSDPRDAERLGKTILELQSKVGFCESCGSITEDPECAICKDVTRNREIVCVVEGPQDVLILEKTGEYRGLYHVLHGVLSPIDGIGPDDLNLKSLEERVKTLNIKEVIIATNPSLEGDTTALYIRKALEAAPCSVTRLARGLPMGGTLEFADDVTLAGALERREKL